jgi:molybdate transport repressor ModE-like protein
VRLDIRHLEVLLAVAESGSISGAARELGVDQPHVSRQLRRIEELLGTSVFVRSARGVTATTHGLRVLALARRAVGVLDELAHPVTTDLGGVAGGSLRVLYHRLPATAVLDCLGAEYPGLQAQLRATTPAAAVAELRAGRAEMFLGVWLPHVRWPDPGPVAVVNVLADPTRVHLAAGHPLAAHAELRLSDLADEPWIVGTDDDSCTTVTQECRLVGGFEPRLAHRVGDESTASALLAQGRGVMLGSSVAARAPGVVRRAYRGSSPARWMQGHLPGRVDRDLVATVAEVLRDEHRTRSDGRRNAVGVALEAPRAG